MRQDRIKKSDILELRYANEMGALDSLYTRPTIELYEVYTSNSCNMHLREVYN